MPRYIEVSDFLHRLYDGGNRIDRKHADNHFVNGIMTAVEVVRDTPTADVEPVVHAHWEQVEDERGVDIRCSYCWESIYKSVASVWENDLPKRCPECGAKMDEEVQE